MPRNPDESSQGLRRIGPWAVKRSRDIYSNPWIMVREDEVIQPGGAPGIYGVVSYRNLAIGVVPLDDKGEVTLVGQHRYPFDAYSWEIPEGGCRPEKETAEEAARRELREETGWRAGRLDYLGCFALSNSVSDEVAHLYLARDLVHGDRDPDPTEEIALKKVSFSEACRMAEEGELNESLSIVALLRARHFLECERRGKPRPAYLDKP